MTISLGLINFNALINSFVGALISEQAPAAIDKAFRLYQLPQGIFSVAVATVLKQRLVQGEHPLDVLRLNICPCQVSEARAAHLVQAGGAR